MTNPLRVTVDSRLVDELMRRLEPAQFDKVMRAARAAGGRKGGAMLRSKAPRGASDRAGQFYRREGLEHGTFARSVRFRSIRRGSRQGIRGVVMGPMGRLGFTRHWIAYGTAPHLIPPSRGFGSIASLATGRTSFREHPGTTGHDWLGEAADAVLAAATEAAERVMWRYVDSGYSPPEVNS